MPQPHTVFSDEWDMSGPEQVALSIPISIETVLMDNGGLAVLTKEVDSYSQMENVQAGRAKPYKHQVFYPATMLREMGRRFLDAADASDRMAQRKRN